MPRGLRPAPARAGAPSPSASRPGRRGDGIWQRWWPPGWVGDKGDRSHRASMAKGKGFWDPPCLDEARITVGLGGQELTKGTGGP